MGPSTPNSCTKAYNANYSLSTWPDFVPIAQAMGGGGITVRELMELDVLANVVENLDGPFIVDVRLDPNVHVMADMPKQPLIHAD